jgi:hypothetical protein
MLLPTCLGGHPFSFLLADFGRAMLPHPSAQAASNYGVADSYLVRFRRDAFSSVLTPLDRVSLRRSRHKPLARSVEKRQVSDKRIRVSARPITLYNAPRTTWLRWFSEAPHWNLPARYRDAPAVAAAGSSNSTKPKTLCGGYIGSVWNFMVGPLFAAQRSCCMRENERARKGI